MTVKSWNFKDIRRLKQRLTFVWIFSAPAQAGPGAHPVSYTMCTESLSGKGGGVGHAPPSRVMVKERVELYFYSPFRPSWPFVSRVG
jgi:hypothetical protein